MRSIFRVCLGLSVGMTGGICSEAHAKIFYSRDQNFAYYKQPVPWVFDDDQREMMKTSLHYFTEEFQKLAATHPTAQKVLGGPEAITEAIHQFNTKADSLIETTRLFYDEVSHLEWNQRTFIPTGLLVFVGTEFNVKMGGNVGGSATLGWVVIPVKVTRVNLRTGEVRHSYTYDASWVVWPAVNVGASAGVGLSLGNRRIGFGLVFGSLDRAEDFQGLVMGVSGGVRLKTKFGINAKAQLLFNLSRPEFVDNVFFTLALEDDKAESESALQFAIPELLSGKVLGAELHGNISFVTSGGAAIEKILQWAGFDSYRLPRNDFLEPNPGTYPAPGLGNEPRR